MGTPYADSVAVGIRAGAALIEGDLVVPPHARGLVVFAHGSSRFSQRNRAVSDVLVHGGCATLLLELLTRQEDVVDQRTREYRFEEPGALAEVSHLALEWCRRHLLSTRTRAT